MYNQSEKKKSITQVNIKERSKYTGVFVTKFKRGFTLPTTFTVTEVNGHEVRDHQFISHRQARKLAVGATFYLITQ